MKSFFRIAFILLLPVIVFTLSGYYFWHIPKYHLTKNNITELPDQLNKKFIELKTRADLIKNFAAKNNYNTEVCFLVNFNIVSGGKRFFVYDLKKDSLLDAGLVTHGRCNEKWLEGRKYGNTIGCGCSSLGRYKIGKPYMGSFGLAYKLHGLDETNSNAFKRFVVLHAHECVPENEVKPYPICQSDGCPTVSPEFLKRLKTILDQSKKPVLLWIYE